MEVVLVALRGSLQQLGVPLPKQLLQPGAVDGTGGDSRALTARHRQPIGQLGDGQHVLAGQDRLQSDQRVQGLICQLPVVQPCKREV